MKVIRSKALPEVLVIDPEIHRDHRGHFLETYREGRYRREAGIESSFVQDNLARSRKGVLRGLHYQHPYPQGKLVQALRGAIYDVVVDLREGSPTCGRWEGIRLTAESRRQVWVPSGFAHGYLCLEAITEVYYKCTNVYHPETQHTLRWDDPEIDVDWPLSEVGDEAPVLSEKDASGQTLQELRAADALPRRERDAPLE